MDPELFEQAAMPLFEQLYNFAHWLTGERSEAEDLVQETYAKALKGFKAFDGVNLRAWMYRILRNTFLTSRTGLAAQKTMQMEEDAPEPGHEVTPEAVLLAGESRQAVLDALGALPVGQREVLLLCEMEELSYKEMAEVLGVPVGTVMSRLARARGALRMKLTGGVR